MNDFSLFHVIAHDDQTEAIKGRKIAVATQQRLDGRYAKFLASDIDSFDARWAYIEDEARGIVAATIEEFDADVEPDGILKAYRSSRAPKTRERTAAVHEARKPRMCPFHKDVTDISLASGDPRAGFDSMAQHWGGPRHCEGDGYKGESCKFRPEMTTQSYWDERSEKLQQQRDEKAQRELTEVPEQTEPGPDTEPAVEAEPDELGGTPPSQPEEATDPTEYAEVAESGEAPAEAELAPLALAASHEGGFQRFAPLSEYDQYFGGEPGAAAKAKKSMIEQYGEEKGESVFYATVNKKKKKSSDHTATETTGLGGPVPTMDKRTWTPRAFDAPLPVDDPDGRNPTRHQDILEPVKPTNADRRHPGTLNDIGGQMTERQDVTKSRNPQGTDSDTWTDGPKKAISFVSDDEVAEAIRRYKS